MSRQPPKQGYFRELLLRLMITRPLLSVMRPLHVLVYWFAASAGAVLTGVALAGTPSSPANRGLGVAGWFVASMVFAGWWVVRQRAERPALPGYQDVPIYWTVPVTSLLFALLFSPAVSFEIAASAAIRAQVDRRSTSDAAAVFYGGHVEGGRSEQGGWGYGGARVSNRICYELSDDGKGQISTGRLRPFIAPQAVDELSTLCSAFKRHKYFSAQDGLTKVSEPIMASVSSCAEAHDYPLGTHWVRPLPFYAWIGLTIWAATALTLTNIVAKRLVAYSAAGAIGAALLIAFALEGSKAAIGSFSPTFLGSIVGSFLALAAFVYVARRRATTIDVLFSLCWFGPSISVLIEMLLNADAFETQLDPSSGRVVRFATALDGKTHGLEIGVILLTFYCVSSILLLPGLNRYRRLPRHR